VRVRLLETQVLYEFGLKHGPDAELRNVRSAYWVPIRRAFRGLRRQKSSPASLDRRRSRNRTTPESASHAQRQENVVACAFSPDAQVATSAGSKTCDRVRASFDVTNP